MKGKRITFGVPNETNKTGIVMDKVRVDSAQHYAGSDNYIVNVNGKAYLVAPNQIISFE